jgi:hypothetical protein
MKEVGTLSAALRKSITTPSEADAAPHRRVSR